jgi:Holliday junction resolvase RusA-like endonuclease
MASVSFTVPGDPKGWARARVRTTTEGKPVHFMDRQTRSWEGVVKLFGQQAMRGREPFAEPVTLSLVFRRLPPKSVSKAQRAAMLAGRLRPGTKPDGSNLAKAVEDALNGVAYRDDALIVRLIVDKVYADTPGVDVTVTPYSGPEQ